MSGTIYLQSERRYWGKILDMEITYKVNPNRAHDGCMFLITKYVVDGVQVDAAFLTESNRNAIRGKIIGKLSIEEKTILGLNKKKSWWW